MKKMTYALSLIATVLIIGIGVGVVSFYGGSGAPGLLPGIDGMGPLVTIEDEEVSYGAQAEVIGPIAGQEKATTAKVGYDGAITVQYYSSSASSYTLQVSANDKSSFIRNIPADNSTLRIPLIHGTGTYTLIITEMVNNSVARTVSTHSVQAGGTVQAGTTTQTAQPSTDAAAQSGTSASGWVVDTSDSYLTAVSDINWSENLTSVKKARELCTTSMTEKEKAQAVYNHLVAMLTYNFDIVGKLPSGYTPNMDTTYSTKTGICYDFSSLYAGMMRSVGVKCKLVKGYNSMVDGYHAWNEVYYDGGWHRIDLTIDSQLRAYKATYGFSTPQGTVTVTSSY